MLYNNQNCSYDYKKQNGELNADRLQDGLLKHVKSSGFQGDADSLLVLVIVKATEKHLVDDALKTRVDAFLLLIFWQFSVFHTQLGVMVNALG